MRFKPDGPGKIRVVIEIGDTVTLVDGDGRHLVSPQVVPASRTLSWDFVDHTGTPHLAVLDHTGDVLYYEATEHYRIYRGMTVNLTLPDDDGVGSLEALTDGDRAWLRAHGWRQEGTA